MNTDTICKSCKHYCPGYGCEFSDSYYKKETKDGELVKCEGYFKK